LERRISTCKVLLVCFLNLASQVIIDQKEYQNISQLKKLKEEYKKYYDSLKPLRADIEYCAKLTDQCRQKLMTEFEQWYESIYGPQLSEQNRGADVYFFDIGCIGYWREI
jgi:kinesin family protein 6/9